MTVEVINGGSSLPYPEGENTGGGSSQVFVPTQQDRQANFSDMKYGTDPSVRLATVLEHQIPSYLLQGMMQEDTASIVEPIEEIPPQRVDLFHQLKFTEADGPLLVDEARRIHAEGYHAMGFVKDDALTPEGFLADGIDKSQGEYTDYYLALNPDDESDRSTLRIINLPPGGKYTDLPAYKVSQHKLSLEGITFLSGLENQDLRLKELAALSRTTNGNPIAVHEIFRRIIHDAQGKDEVWFFSIVSTTYESLVKTMGKESFMVIGEDVPVGDERVNSNIVLRPALFQPDKFYDSLLQAYQTASSPADQARLRRSLIFFAEGLSDDQLSSEYAQARRELLQDDK